MHTGTLTDEHLIFVCSSTRLYLDIERVSRLLEWCSRVVFSGTSTFSYNGFVYSAQLPPFRSTTSTPLNCMHFLVHPFISARTVIQSLTYKQRPSVQSSERSNIRVIYQQLVKFIYFKWIYYTRKEIYLFVCYVMPLTLAIVCIRVFILDTIPIIAYGKGCLYICCCCYHK